MSNRYSELGAQMTSPGQMFEVTEVEVRGQQLKTWANAPGNLRDLWMMSAAHGDKDYLVYKDERWTYADAHRDVAALAGWLAANGVQQHDRVAIAMRNYPEWMLSYWAATSMGAVAVGMNAWWVSEEMAYALNDSAPKVLICDEERLQRLEPIRDQFPELIVVAVRCEAGGNDVAWQDTVAAEAALPDTPIDPDDDACIFYTSGTTGYPKGAQLTHRGCTNNVMSVVYAQMFSAALISQDTGEAPPDPTASGLQPSTIVATPLFHVTANNCVAQALTAGGGKLVHMYKWDPGEALRLIEEEKVTVFTGVPVMSREILAHPDFATRDTSTLASLGGGGAPLQPDLVEKIDKDSGGSAPSQGYGMTEVCGIIAAIGGSLFSDRPRSTGLVVPVFDVKCIDENGEPVPTGERGEVCVKGAQVIKGYINRPEATADSIIDGWLHTGDIGYIDEDGFLYLVDRAKDMVLRGGENVYCSEVETVLFQHDDVAEASVFSVPDDRLGEEVGAAIYGGGSRTPNAEEIREYCKGLMAAHKVPRYIWICEDPLPRNASGKFLKRELQQELALEDAQ